MLPTENQWNRALFKWKKFGCLSNCSYCAECAQNLPGPAPNNMLTVLHISFTLVHYRRSNSRTRQRRFCLVRYYCYRCYSIIWTNKSFTRREAMLRRVLEFTLIRLYSAFWTAFTQPTVTLPKVNRFGWNLENCQLNVGAGHGRFWARSAQYSHTLRGSRKNVCFFIR